MSVSEHFTAALAGGGTALAVFTQDGLSSLDKVRIWESDSGTVIEEGTNFCKMSVSRSWAELGTIVWNSSRSPRIFTPWGEDVVDAYAKEMETEESLEVGALVEELIDTVPDKLHDI